MKLGLAATQQDFNNLGAEDSPTYEPYEDESDGKVPLPPPKEFEPTPKSVPRNYLHASMVLP